MKSFKTFTGNWIEWDGGVGGGRSKAKTVAAGVCESVVSTVGPMKIGSFVNKMEDHMAVVVWERRLRPWKSVNQT